jgi:hypothetical protein
MANNYKVMCGSWMRLNMDAESRKTGAKEGHGVRYDTTDPIVDCNAAPLRPLIALKTLVLEKVHSTIAQHRGPLR